MLSKCIEWSGAIGGHGYGVVRCGKKMMRAHRQAWIAQHGEIPSGMLVLHKCDNPRCIKLSHLFLGTHKDNMVDMASKGRNRFVRRFGKNNAMSKLTEMDVRQIKKLISKGVSDQDISKKYPVTRPAIYAIRAKKSWKHVQ